MYRVFYDYDLCVPAMAVADLDGNVAVVVNVLLVEAMPHDEQASLFNDLFEAVGGSPVRLQVPLRIVS